MSSSRSHNEALIVPEIRAWLITDIAHYVPDDARPRFIAGLSPALQTLFTRARGDRNGWAPLSLFIEALEAADRVAGRGDFASCWEIGRSTAKRESGVVRSFALRVLRPTALLSLATSLWSVHYRNAGRAVVRGTGPRGLSFSLVDFPFPHRAHCLAVGGWVQGALELGPRRHINVGKTACRCEGASMCDYEVTWEEA
jgi:hypothetical protein